MTTSVSTSATSESTLILVHTSAPINNRQDESFRTFAQNYAGFTGRKHVIVEKRKNIVIEPPRTPAKQFLGSRNICKRDKVASSPTDIQEDVVNRQKRVKIDNVHEQVEVSNSPGMVNFFGKFEPGGTLVNCDVVYYPMPALSLHTNPSLLHQTISPVSSNMADISMIPSSLVSEDLADALEERFSTPSQMFATPNQIIVPNTVTSKPEDIAHRGTEAQHVCYETPDGKTLTLEDQITPMVPNTVFAEGYDRESQLLLATDEFSSLSMESSDEVPDSQPSLPSPPKFDPVQLSTCPVSPLQDASLAMSLEGFSPVSPLSVQISKEKVVTAKNVGTKFTATMSKISEVTSSCDLEISSPSSPPPGIMSTPTPSPSKHVNVETDTKIMTDVDITKKSEEGTTKQDEHSGLFKLQPLEHGSQAPGEMSSELALVESSPNKQSKKLPKFSSPIQPTLLSLIIQQSTGTLYSQTTLKQHIKKYSLKDYHIYPPFSKINPRLSRITPRMSTIYKSANPKKYYKPKHVSRLVLPSERGYWRLDLHLWPKADTKAEKCATVNQKLEFWKKVQEYVSAGKLGDVRVEFEGEGEGAGGNVGDVIRVYCFGEAVVHVSRNP